MISEYRFKIDQYQQQIDNKTSYLKSQLQQYFETVDRKKTKTQETYKLPSGTLKKKYPSPDFIRDEEKLLKWLKDSNMTDLIKTKESADWATLKKAIQIEGTNVVTEDGEIVDGITVQEKDPVFDIEV